MLLLQLAVAHQGSLFTDCDVYLFVSLFKFYSRSALLTGMPSHQNGMYGLHQAENNFNSFSNIVSLPTILKSNGIKTGFFKLSLSYKPAIKISLTQ